MTNPETLFGVSAFLYVGALSIFWDRWWCWLLANVMCVAVFYSMDAQGIYSFDRIREQYSALLALAFGGGVLSITAFFDYLLRENIVVLRGTRLRTVTQLNRLSKRKSKEFISLGNARIPLGNDGIMIAIIGETGSGKTQAIMQLSLQIQARGERQIVFDPGADLFRYLYRDGDFILSPEDERTVDWSPYSEIRGRSDCLTLTEGIIGNRDGESASWYQNAQQLSADVIWTTYQKPESTNADLLRAICHAPTNELSELLSDTPSARFMEPGSDKQLGSLLGIAASNFRSIGELNPSASHRSFSIRKYCEQRHDQKNLWITYSDLTASLTAPLRRCWSRLIIRTLISGVENSCKKTPRTWLIMDELPSNGSLDDLQLGAARGRKYALSVIVGLQSTSQLDEIYGHDATRSLLGNFGNILILRSPEERSAKQLAAAVGTQEIERPVLRGNDRREMVREMRDAVLPAEIMSLKNLNGILKISELGWARVALQLVSRKLKPVATFRPKYSISTEPVGKTEPQPLDLDDI